MSVSLTSDNKRSKLTPRREPYWDRVEAGCYLGFRVAQAGGGTWIARWRDDSGKQNYKALGGGIDHPEALKSARAWFKHCQQGASPQIITVGDACRDYINNKRTEDGNKPANEAETRFKRLVYGTPLESVPLDKLQASRIRKWRDAQLIKSNDDDEERRNKDTINRNLVILKAALNFAFKSQHIGTDSGWKSITKFKGVGGQRERFLSTNELQDILKACPDNLGRFCRGLLLLGCRPGELAGAKVGDFDKNAGTLILDGKTGKRTITLSSDAAGFIMECCRLKTNAVHIFLRDDGLPWTKDSWKKPFQKAVIASGVSNPKGIVIYSLRHAALSQMVGSGLDSFIVAQIAGTSVAMIEKHYGHMHHSKNRAVLDKIKIL